MKKIKYNRGGISLTDRGLSENIKNSYESLKPLVNMQERLQKIKKEVKEEKMKKTRMKKHPQAGTIVKIVNGTFKDKYFKVIDYFVNQYQGKSMENLKKSQAALLNPVLRRKLPVDDEVVFGQFYPALEYACLHDTELQFKEVPPEELPDNVTSIKGKKNDSGTTTAGDNKPTSTRSTRSKGRSVPSEKTPNGVTSGDTKTEEDA